MPLMFDLRTTRPVGELSIEGSFDSKGNGLGFDWQGNTLQFDFNTPVQFLIIEKREVDSPSSGETQKINFKVDKANEDFISVCEDVTVEIVDDIFEDGTVKVELDEVTTTDTTVELTITAPQQLYVYWHLYIEEYLIEEGEEVDLDKEEGIVEVDDEDLLPICGEEETTEDGESAATDAEKEEDAAEGDDAVESEAESGDADATEAASDADSAEAESDADAAESSDADAEETGEAAASLRRLVE